MPTVIEFPAPSASDETALDRQLYVSTGIDDLAQRLYHLRCRYLGGNFLMWHELTALQRSDFHHEVEMLVTEITVKGATS